MLKMLSVLGNLYDPTKVNGKWQMILLGIDIFLFYTIFASVYLLSDEESEVDVNKSAITVPLGLLKLNVVAGTVTFYLVAIIFVSYLLMIREPKKVPNIFTRMTDYRG